MFTVVHTLAEPCNCLKLVSRKLRQFINAKSTKEVLFGTTTGLNWIGRFAERFLSGQEMVVISIMEPLQISFLGRKLVKEDRAKTCLCL